MARTKQTARKSSGGGVQLAVKGANHSAALRKVLTSHQSVGAVSRPSREVSDRASYLNHENVLGSFYYSTTPTDAEFHPNLSLGSVAHPQSGLPEQWMCVLFASKYDGPGLAKYGRPPLSLVIVLDISGSMGCVLMGDLDNAVKPFQNSKLKAAKECISAILDQLDRNDQVGIVLFNHDAYDLQSPVACTRSSKRGILELLEAITPGGGTNLAKGFRKGMEMLDTTSSSEKHLLKRVVFLTDMQSSVADEHAVLHEANLRASAKKLHTTVVGIGVDLSVGTVERISKMEGGKYISVSSAKEFRTSVGSDFSHDVCPVAFRIKIELHGGYTIERACGSAELNSIAPGVSHVSLSSEFASPLNNQGEMQGGAFLLKLKPPHRGKQRPRKLKVKISWVILQGVPYSVNSVLDVPGQGVELPGNLRKALALTRFVDIQSAYCLSKGKEGLPLRLEHLEELRKCRTNLLSEMESLGDDSLHSENLSFLQTLDQIIMLEEKETTNFQGDFSQNKRSRRSGKQSTRS